VSPTKWVSTSRGWEAPRPPTRRHRRWRRRKTRLGTRKWWTAKTRGSALRLALTGELVLMQPAKRTLRHDVLRPAFRIALLNDIPHYDGPESQRCFLLAWWHYSYVCCQMAHVMTLPRSLF
jgi:hypothetical protein